MSVSLAIVVDDITNTIAAGYTHIKVYRSPEDDTGFFEITTPSVMLELQPGVSNYSFVDTSGTTQHWYKTTFYDANLPAESAFSDPFRGDFVDTNFRTATYPEEGLFTPYDRLVISRVRSLVGDRKEVSRDYISAETGYSSISSDGKTYTFSNPKGWPLSVELDGIEHTSLTDPYVQDYQFLTFSGSQVSTVSGVLDVWYYHFRYSDSEIMTAFNSLTAPYPLTPEDISFDFKILSVAIELLAAELSAAGVNSGVEVDIYEEIRINPKLGLDSRFSNLKRLMDQRDAMIALLLRDRYSLFGVLID